jgi:hypothetical protein
MYLGRTRWESFNQLYMLHCTIWEFARWW